jgi:hypothetical protein
MPHHQRRGKLGIVAAAATVRVILDIDLGSEDLSPAPARQEPQAAIRRLQRKWPNSSRERRHRNARQEGVAHRASEAEGPQRAQLATEIRGKARGVKKRRKERR